MLQIFGHGTLVNHVNPCPPDQEEGGSMGPASPECCCWQSHVLSLHRARAQPCYSILSWCPGADAQAPSCLPLAQSRVGKYIQGVYLPGAAEQKGKCPFCQGHMQQKARTPHASWCQGFCACVNPLWSLFKHSLDRLSLSQLGCPSGMGTEPYMLETALTGALLWLLLVHSMNTAHSALTAYCCKVHLGGLKAFNFAPVTRWAFGLEP